MEPQPEQPISARPSPLCETLSYLILLGGAVTAVVSANMVASTYSALPHWDEWELVDRFATGKPWSLPWLWMQHNEHRIPFAKILFFVDARFFHGSQVLMLAGTFLALIFQVVLLSWILRAFGGMRGTTWRTGTGFIAFCILSPIQQENLVWGFQFTFVLPAVMATLATSSFLLAHRGAGEEVGGKRSFFLLLSIVAASVATFSLANGMLVWPLLVLATVILKERYSIIAALLLAAVINIGGFLYHYQIPTRPVSPSSLQHFRDVLEYVGLYFGSTWIHHASGYAPVIIGLAGLCGALVIVARVGCRQPRCSLFLFQMSLLMLFCVATAGVTAFGRVHLGLEQATASRYQVFALLFWCALGLSVLSETIKPGPSSRNLAVFSGFLFVLMLAAATQARHPLHDATWHQIRLQAISNALLAGVNDSDQLTLSFPDPNVVIRDAHYLRRNRLSIFANQPYAQLGQPLSSAYQVRSAEECSGYIASSQVFPAVRSRGLRLTGYAWNRARRAPVIEVVFVSGDGRISGFGSTVTIPLSSVKPGPNADAKRFGWLGYAGNITQDMEAYGMLDKKRGAVCPFAKIAF